MHGLMYGSRILPTAVLRFVRTRQQLQDGDVNRGNETRLQKRFPGYISGVIRMSTSRKQTRLVVDTETQGLSFTRAISTLGSVDSEAESSTYT